MNPVLIVNKSSKPGRPNGSTSWAGRSLKVISLVTALTASGALFAGGSTKTSAPAETLQGYGDANVALQQIQEGLNGLGLAEVTRAEIQSFFKTRIGEQVIYEKGVMIQIFADNFSGAYPPEADILFELYGPGCRVNGVPVGVEKFPWMPVPPSPPTSLPTPCPAPADPSGPVRLISDYGDPEVAAAMIAEGFLALGLEDVLEVRADECNLISTPAFPVGGSPAEPVAVPCVTVVLGANEETIETVMRMYGGEDCRVNGVRINIAYPIVDPFPITIPGPINAPPGYTPGPKD